MAAEDYAIVVGITHYPGINNLKGAENDAGRFYEWLIAADGGAVPEEQAKLILSRHYDPPASTRQDAKPIAQDIISLFERLIDKGEANETKRTGRRLYIFLAGHGFSPLGYADLPGIEEAALLMANAQSPRYMGYHIPGRGYALWFITSALFDEVVLFMDCCRDNYTRVSAAFPPWLPLDNNRAQKVRPFYGFATEWSRKSRERIIVDGGEVRGLFTWSLLKGLQGNARDKDGCLTSGSLKRFVHNFLPTLFTPKQIATGQNQRAKFEGDEDIILDARKPPARARVSIDFTALDANLQVTLIDPSLKLLGQHLPKDGIWEIDLEPGIYSLSEANTNREQFFKVLGTEVIHVQF
jgi:Caspase domain